MEQQFLPQTQYVTIHFNIYSFFSLTAFSHLFQPPGTGVICFTNQPNSHYQTSFKRWVLLIGTTWFGVYTGGHFYKKCIMRQNPPNVRVLLLSHSCAVPFLCCPIRVSVVLPHTRENPKFPTTCSDILNVLKLVILTSSSFSPND